MNDRELLERAAQAAGYAFQWFGANFRIQQQDRLWALWAPLTDDGDALRLAVKLRMRVEPWGAGASAVASIDNRALVAERHYGDDPERATRRAITRAAAEMGEGTRPFPTAKEIREEWT